MSLALGDVKASLAIALGFAAGRALPVLLLSETAIAERPQGLRLLRVLAAASLLAALVAGQVQAAGTVASPGGDPSVEGTDVAWQQPGVGGFLRRDGTTTQLPGNDPALGATFVAWHAGSTRDGRRPHDADAGRPGRRARRPEARRLAQLARLPHARPRSTSAP